jgi:hypothetical protein
MLLHRHRALRSVIKCTRQVALRQGRVVVNWHMWLPVPVSVQALMQLRRIHQSKNIATILKLCMRDRDPGDIVTGVAWFDLRTRPRGWGDKLGPVDIVAVIVTVNLTVNLRWRWPVFGAWPDDGRVVRRGQRAVVPLLAWEEPTD